MKIIDLKQGSSEWLEYRKNKIGSSDAPIILNISPWTSPLQLWERKIGIAQEQKESAAMSRGKALEDEARCAFMMQKEIIVTPEVVQHETLDWCSASLDGLSSCHKYAVEIKCPGREDHLLAFQGIISEKYQAQLQHQLAVTGIDMIYYYSYDGHENVCIQVRRNQEYIDKLIEEELKFYNCIITATPPDLTDQDYNIRCDKEWDYATRYWLRSQATLKDAEYHEKKARQELIEASKSKNSRGYGVKVQKIMRQGAVQYSELECLKGVDLDKYRKPKSESWRITLDE